MSSKNNTEVIIDGKIFTLSGYESEEYLQKVAAYINNKIIEFKKEEAYRRQNIDVQKALLDLNIADDYFKAKKQADALESELEDKDKQLYDVKHELISVQIKLDACEKEKEDLKNQLSEIQKELIRYETIVTEMKKENDTPETGRSSKKNVSRKSSAKSVKASSEKNYSLKNMTNEEAVEKKTDNEEVFAQTVSKTEEPVSEQSDSTYSSNESFTKEENSFEQMDLFGSDLKEKEELPSDHMSKEVDKILSSLGE